MLQCFDLLAKIVPYKEPWDLEEDDRVPTDFQNQGAPL